MEYGLPGVVDGFEDINRVSGGGVVDSKGSDSLGMFIFEVLESGVGVVSHVIFPRVDSILFAFLLDGFNFR